jgi:membrane protein implicated in regulation of membrane protease activity
MGWVLWLVLAVAFGLGELHTGGFYLLPFALGATLAALVTLLGVGALLATIVFLVGSGTVVLALRPVARRHRRLPPAIRTGAAALIGRRAMVLERIANNEGSGCVRIEGGEVWTARSFDDDEVIEAGERVEVVEIRGATALVMP